MFLGTYTPKLDEKGRFFLPARFRDELADGLVIAKGQERCLSIYTVAAFSEEARVAMSGSSTMRGIRDFQRTFGSGASEEIPDKQGRVMIPAVLRAYAALDKEIAVIGALSRVEVWDHESWLRYRAVQDEEYSTMDAPLGRVPSEGEASIR